MTPTLKRLPIEDEASMQAALPRALNQRAFRVTGRNDGAPALGQWLSIHPKSGGQ